MSLVAIIQDHGSFIWRFLHVFFGIIWIGHLYYFNFVQTPFFAETDNATKSGVIQKLVPRALWWFRWGAMFTFITGLMLLALGLFRGGVDNWQVNLSTQWGLVILPGALLGTIMFLNVWLIIWPNQKIVIASTLGIAQGKPADPRAANAGARAGVASRTNALFSIPMLFSMLATGHLSFPTGVGEAGKDILYFVVFIILALVIEANAIWGKLVGPLKTVKGVVHAGLAFTLVFYLLMELMIANPQPV